MHVGNISRVSEYLTRQQENKTSFKLLQVLTSHILVFILHCKYYLFLVQDMFALPVNIT